MKSFVYPAVFIKDNEDDDYKVIFPDLDITTDGKFVEEAFLYAEELLKAYFVAIMKYDFDFNMPTDFARVRKSAKANDIVMLISAEVTKKDLA